MFGQLDEKIVTEWKNERIKDMLDVLCDSYINEGEEALKRFRNGLKLIDDIYTIVLSRQP